MKNRLIAIAGIAAALVLSSVDAGAADAVKPPDAQQIQRVVAAHLKALAEDDATQAYALAPREMREETGSPENFLQLIKQAYSPIYHNRLAILSKPQTVNGQIVQTARITDAGNRIWVAVFQMEQDERAGWKIGNCTLIETDSVAV